MTRKNLRLAAVAATVALLVGACGGDDDDGDTAATADTSATDSTAATESAPTTALADDDTESTEAAEDSDAAGWTVGTDDCVDPDRANAPIEGTVNIGASAPLSGGPAAAAFAPVVAGYQAYIDYANENGLLPEHEIVLTVGDDQYDPALTPGVVNGELDNGANLFSGILGTPANAAVRDLLNEECVPQLMVASAQPMFGDAENYPWTIGGALPVNKESAAYAAAIAREFPDGATVGGFYVNNDLGAGYRDALDELADEFGLEIVDEQTIEAAETTPPTAQLSSLAGKAPDVVVAAPLGAQCPTFLTELANQKAANPEWEPLVYLSSNCASPLILGTAGEAADGIFTTTPYGAINVVDPATHDIPGIAAYLSSLESAGLSETVPTSLAGWITGEVTVEILRQAAESPEGLTPASIMNAARNLDYTPSTVREGIPYRASGVEDPFLVESVQVLQYDAAAKSFNDVGELIHDFESS